LGGSGFFGKISRVDIALAAGRTGACPTLSFMYNGLRRKMPIDR
jgi:hypothetical protein